jgi:DNA-directed RNA polymerase subunit K/omega
MSDIENSDSDSDSYNFESNSDSEENKLPIIKKVITTNNTDDLLHDVDDLLDEVDEVEEVEEVEEEDDNKAFGVDQNDDNSDYEYNSNAEDEDEDEDEDEPSRKKSKTKQTINLGNQSVNKSFDLNYDKDDDEEEDDDDDDEHYLQKFNSDINKTYISEFHPECIIHNYEEVSALSHVVRDNNGIIVDDLHKTIPFLTKYERARILGQRAKQIECGAKPFVKVPDNIVDSYIIADLELKQKKIPFIIRRPIPNGGCEYWNLKDLEMIHF